MEKQLKDYSIVELKSLVYDELAKIEICQNNVKLLNQEIRERINKENSNERSN